MKRSGPLQRRTALRRTSWPDRRIPDRGDTTSAGSGKRRSGRIRSVSEKRAALIPERRAFVERILSERPLCEAPMQIYEALGGPPTSSYSSSATWLFAHGISEEDVVVLRAWAERCQFRSVDVHELRKRSRGGSIVDEVNVTALCRRCHEETEREPRLATLVGLLVPSWSVRR